MAPSLNPGTAQNEPNDTLQKALRFVLFFSLVAAIAFGTIPCVVLTIILDNGKENGKTIRNVFPWMHESGRLKE